MSLTLFYVEYGFGCGIVAAKNLRNARRNVLREHGTANVSSVKTATQANVDYVLAFGGHVPSGTVAAGRKRAIR